MVDKLKPIRGDSLTKLNKTKERELKSIINKEFFLFSLSVFILTKNRTKLSD